MAVREEFIYWNTGKDLYVKRLPSGPIQTPEDISDNVYQFIELEKFYQYAVYEAAVSLSAPNPATDRLVALIPVESPSSQEISAQISDDAYNEANGWDTAMGRFASYASAIIASEWKANINGWGDAFNTFVDGYVEPILPAIDGQRRVLLQASQAADLFSDADVATLVLAIIDKFDGASEVPVQTIAAACASAILITPANKISTLAGGVVQAYVNEMGVGTITDETFDPGAVSYIQSGLASESNATINRVAVIAAIEAGSGSSQPLNVNILPNVARQSELQEGSKLKAYVRQRSPIFASVYDSAEEPVDLSGVTLKLWFDDDQHQPLLSITDITVTGTDQNTFHFDPPEVLVAKPRLLNWSLRNNVDDDLIASGTIEIAYAP